MDHNVTELVSLRYTELSTNERRIADYLLSHARELTFASASQLARLVGVSASTVVRFAQHLGFEGYVDLQTRLQREFARGERLETVPVQSGDFIEHLLAQEQQNLAGIRGQSEALGAAAVHLASARRLWITGSRTSQHMAGLAMHMFNLIRPDVWQLEPGGGQVPERLQDMSPNDVLLAFSMSRYARDTVRLVRQVARTVPLVLVTDRHVAPLRSEAHVVVTFSSVPAAMVRSLTAGVMTIQALLALTAHEIGTEQVQERLDRAALLWQEFDTFAIRDAGPDNRL